MLDPDFGMKTKVMAKSTKIHGFLPKSTDFHQNPRILKSVDFGLKSF